MKAILKVSKVKQINTFLDKQFLTTRRKEKEEWDFPGYPVVKTSLSSERERYTSSIPGQGAKTHMPQCPKKKKKQQVFSGNCMLKPRRHSEYR